MGLPREALESVVGSYRDRAAQSMQEKRCRFNAWLMPPPFSSHFHPLVDISPMSDGDNIDVSARDNAVDDSMVINAM